MMQIVDLLYPNKYQAEPAVFKQADLTGFDRSLGSFFGKCEFNWSQC